MRIISLTEETKKDILDNLLKRSPNSYGEYEEKVRAIIEEVRNKRDEALFSYTKMFDGVEMDSKHVLVTEKEIQEVIQSKLNV